MSAPASRNLQARSAELAAAREAVERAQQAFLAYCREVRTDARDYQLTEDEKREFDQRHAAIESARRACWAPLDRWWVAYESAAKAGAL